MKLTASAGGQTALLPVEGSPWLTIAGPLSIDYRPHQNTIATLERALRDRRVVVCRCRALSTHELTFRSRHDDRARYRSSFLTETAVPSTRRAFRNAKHTTVSCDSDVHADVPR